MGGGGTIIYSCLHSKVSPPHPGKLDDDRIKLQVSARRTRVTGLRTLQHHGCGRVIT